MANPTVRWDNDFAWDLSTWDGPALGIIPDPRRTVKIVGDQSKKYEFLKDPASKLDYTFDWTGWLAQGDTVASGVVSTTSGLIVTGLTPSARSVTLWAEGGLGQSPSEPVAIRCQVTTTQGRIDSRTLYLRIEER